MLPKEKINQFKILYKKNFDEELSDEEALEKSALLIRLFQIIYKPMTEKEFGLLQAKRKELRINNDQ